MEANSLSESLKALKNLSALSLSLQNKNFVPSSLQKLLNSITHFDLLSLELDLRNNPIGEQGVEDIISLLPKLPNLKSI